MQKQRVLFVVGIAIVAALAGAWLAHLMSRSENAAPTLTAGTALPTLREIPEFDLMTAQGEPAKLDLFRNHWSVLFFGYTSCPDVCPTTLTQLAQIKKTLGDLPAERQPQFVFISVDPKRDTPTQLAGYLKFFDPSLVGLTGSQEHIDELTHALGVPVVYQPAENGGYSVDHAATLFVVDPKARLYAIFTPPFEVKPISEDVRRIVSQ